MTHEKNCTQNSRLGRLESRVSGIDDRLRTVEQWSTGQSNKLDNIERMVTDIKQSQSDSNIDKGTLAYIVLGFLAATFLSGFIGMLVSMWVNGGGYS